MLVFNKNNTDLVQKLLQIILVLGSFCGTIACYAQENEEQLKARAAKSYATEDYVAASRDYIQLLAIQPRDVFYNYRYGVCLLYNSRKKQDAIRYLEYASKADNIEPEVFFYLGKAYHLNYQFNEAIRLYTQYKTKAGSKAKAVLETDRQIEMCQNGKRLLTTLTDIIVLEKKEIETDKFFRLYDLRDIGGVILVTTDFQSRIDKKKGHVPLVHFPPNAEMIFYTSYGESETNGKDVYYRTRLSDGNWSSPFIAKGYVNSPEDEEFAYMDPAGKYLYFSSKGHNSMGGSDVFRSKYDAGTNAFSAPENLDFAISSPDNDLFYVVDSLDKNAYFASSRQSVDGKIHVYKVRVDRIPLQVAAVKGAFSSTVNPQRKNMTVEVSDAVSGTRLGAFASDDAGNFLITFPKGGKYNYTIKIDGNPNAFAAEVKIPVLREFKPLKQNIQHEMYNGTEVVRIVDLFDEAVEDPAGVLAEIVKMRSELNPNADQYDLKALDQQQANANGAIYAVLGLDNKSALVIRETIAELAEKQTAQVENIENLQQKALGEVAQNAGRIESLQAGTKALANKANTEKDPVVKSGLYTEAAGKIEKINELQVTSKLLLAYHDSLQQLKTGQQQEAQAAQQLSQRVTETAKDNNPDALTQALQDNQDAIRDLQQKPGALPVEVLIEQVLQTRSDIQKRKEKAASYQTASDQLQREINAFQATLEQAKSKDKPGIQSKIDSKKQEQGLVQEEIDLAAKKSKALEQELLDREAQLAYTQEVGRKPMPANPLVAQDVRNSLSGLDNANARTLYSYIQQQQTMLSKDPAVVAAQQTAAASNPNQTATQNNTGGEEIFSRQETHRRRMQAIVSDETLSPAERWSATENASAAFETELQQELEATERALASNPADAAAVTKRENLQKAKAETQVQLAETKEKLNQQGAAPGNAQQAAQTEKLKPGHTAKLETIAANSKLSAAEKTEKAQQEDAALLKVVGAEIKKQAAALKSDPENKDRQQALQTLENIRSSAEDRMATRRTENGTNQTADNPTQNMPEDQATENTSLSIAAFQPEHVAKTKAIAENPKLSPRDKQEQLIQQEVKLQKSLDGALKQARKELAKDPQNAALATKISDLQALQEESQGRTEESRQMIVSDLKSKVDQETLQKQIDPKYTTEMQALQAETGTDVYGKSIVLEENLQTALDKRLAENAVQLSKKDLPELTAQNQVLNEMKDASRQRIDGLREAMAVVADTNSVDIDPILTPVSVRLSDYLAIDAKYFNTTYTAADDLAEQQDKLDGYIAVLERLQEENEENLAKYPGSFYEEDKRVLAAEKAKTQQKLDQVNQQRAALESTGSADPAVDATDAYRLEQQKLAEQEAALQQQLAATATANAEQAQLEKAIAENQRKQAETFNADAQPKLTAQQKEQQQQLKTLEKYTPTDAAQRAKSKAALEVMGQAQEEITAQQAALAAEKDPLAKQVLIEQLSAKQDKLTGHLAELQLDHALDNAARIYNEKNGPVALYDLESAKDLDSRKYRAVIQVGELTALHADLGSEIAETKAGKSQSALTKQQQEIQDYKTILLAEITTLEKALAARRESVVPLVSDKAITEPVSFIQEKEIAASAAYKQVFEGTQPASELLAEIDRQEKQLEKLQQQYHLQLLEQLDKNTSGNIVSSAEITEIHRQQENIEKLRQQYEAARKEFQVILDQTTDPMKIQNLIARGIEPISGLIETPVQTPVPVDPKPVVAVVKSNTPADVKTQSGLVYRVQIGAFSKPISEEKFQRFKPLSGEKLPNGVTRYLAGQFSDRHAVAEAQQQIRAIGYKDAFPVAYCNGARISMEEARKLQESGGCISKEIVPVVLEKTPEPVQQQQPAVIQAPPKTIAAGPADYNKGIGVAPATAVETRPGLFYTVQLGVYNKPVPPAQLKNIEPLVTQRLENGQIRYSAGMFRSVDAAQPKRREAQLRGITDAFITAYYKGNRISLSEASRLLEQQGQGILEQITAADSRIASQPEIEKSIADPALRDTSLVTDAVQVQLQLVSKKTYDTYPRDIVRRFNDKGFFYYDEADKHVKSIIYSDADHLPQVYYFRNELDTVIVGRKLVVEAATALSIHAYYPQPVLDGATGDWLMRLSQQRHLYAQEGKIVLEITGIKDEAIKQELTEKLRSLGFEITHEE